MHKFAIFGAGGHSKVIAEIILSNGDGIEHIVDDNPEGKKSTVLL